MMFQDEGTINDTNTVDPENVEANHPDNTPQENPDSNNTVEGSEQVQNLPRKIGQSITVPEETFI